MAVAWLSRGAITLTERDPWNGSRYDSSHRGGFYESYFLRGNHPTRPLAFWIRYTVFAPKGDPEAAVGQIWAIWFDGDRKKTVAVRTELPFSECHFAPRGLSVRVGDASLVDGSLNGKAELGGHAISWDLQYTGGGDPLLLLSRERYSSGFPKAKSVVPRPNAVFSGALVVDGVSCPVDGWQGSQNHNWGSRHTDRYAWGQVAGFEEYPDAFLEVATARVRLGPVWSPQFTILVLRQGDREIRINGLMRAMRARAGLDGLDWRFHVEDSKWRIRGRIQADIHDFVGLTYRNPPGGQNYCLNSKIARCELIVERRGKKAFQLTSSHGAAFEILTDQNDHGVPILV